MSSSSAALIKQARRSAGLTQQELATRLGVTQAAVAQLEGPRANPSLGTLERALRATGHQLELRAVRRCPSIDTTLLREALRLSPAERLAAADRLLREAERIAAAGARSRRRKRQ